MAIASDSAIKHSDLLHRLILDRSTTEKLGRVGQVWLDMNAHQVVGLTCTSGLWARHQHSFTWTQIETTGTDSILINAQAGPEPQKPASTVVAVDHELWTNAGNKAGRLVDYRIDLQSGAVTDYLFVSNGWRGITEGVYRLPAPAIVTVGPKRVIAEDAAVQNAQQDAAGLSHKMTQTATILKEDYTQSQQDFATGMQGAQEATEQLKAKTQQIASQAQNRFSKLKSQMQQSQSTAPEPGSKSGVSKTASQSDSTEPF